MPQLRNRNLLRRQLKAAWKATMTGPYVEQAINSERALQVHLAQRLLSAFDEEGLNRQLLIEPMVSLGGGACRIHPDILVCNSRSVIGIIELKYQPRIRPSVEKDFQSLEAMSRRDQEIEIENTRHRGLDGGAREFRIADHPLFVWAGVYASPYQAVPPQPPSAALAQNLLTLHAVTHRDRHPTCYAGSREL